jgi:hypothetical protein
MAAPWKPLANQPWFEIDTMVLLTDGSVMCQIYQGRHWFRLRPDSKGNYLKGTWSTLAPTRYARGACTSAVLKDGRVLIFGYGEVGFSYCEIYDPVYDTWTSTFTLNELPVPSVVLADGRVMIGSYLDQRTEIYDPIADTWSVAAQKLAPSRYESWVLMPDGTVLTVQTFQGMGSISAAPATEKYLIDNNVWGSAGNTPDDLGRAVGILLPDGRAFFIGGGKAGTALYTPGANPGDSGTWTAGPSIPNIDRFPLSEWCAPACLMTNGHVLMAVNQHDNRGPHFYEFDGQDLAEVPDPPNATPDGRMLLLPTGEVLYASRTTGIYAYTAAAPGFQDAWRPEIVTVPTTFKQAHSYTLAGRRLNGFSQAVADHLNGAATNYPIIRLRAQNGSVFYCRTFDHSTMAVATGSAIHTTNFHVPGSVPAESYELTVIANGIPSESMTVSVNASSYVPPPETWQWLYGSFADGPLWALGPNGPIPVDPQTPKYRSEVRAARRSIASSIKKLQRIGRRLDKDRLAAARKAKRAVDPDLGKSAGNRAETVGAGGAPSRSKSRSKAVSRRPSRGK